MGHSDATPRGDFEASRAPCWRVAASEILRKLTSATEQSVKGLGPKRGRVV